jgi:hypothetical protein
LRAILAHRYGWSLNQVGTLVPDPTGDGPLRLTKQLVDSGLDELTQLLDGGGLGHHYGVRGLRHFRLPAGSHGVWSSHIPVMSYKILFAAKKLGLSIITFDVGQKSRWVL